jgi:AAA15 family ATPase/GTPase
VLEILNDGSDTQVKLSDAPNLIALVHRGAGGQRVRFNHDEESLGTVVWLGLAGPIIDALDEGSVLLADELDASLHPVLVQHLVQLFQDPESNPRRAQLLFNSHDADLLGDASGDRPLGRDQIWFTEKGDSGDTSVYPLSDMNPRRQEAIAKRYLEGRYGAIPIVAPGDFLAAVHAEPVA